MCGKRVRSIFRGRFLNLASFISGVILPNIASTFLNDGYESWRILDTHHFIQKISGIHQVMVAGNYVGSLHDAMLRMNVDLIGPSDPKPPEV